jgi:DNA polymerase/3'-5' exonuclease PolX
MNTIKSLDGQTARTFHPMNAKATAVILKLQKAIETGESSLTHTQKIVIIYHKDLIKQVPRAEIAKHVEFIQQFAPTTMAAGSYRRGKPYGSDIDVIVRETIDDVVKKLTDAGYIKDTFVQGNKKFSGVVKLPGYNTHRHLDIVFTTPRSYPFALMYFTGSKRFNIRMRLKARTKGLKLNEYGLFNGFVQVGNIQTERDIFKLLGIPYVEPKDR